MGRSAHEAVNSVFEMWLDVDPAFERVLEFYQSVSNSAHGFFMQNILPPMVRWLEGFYKVLRGSVDP